MRYFLKKSYPSKKGLYLQIYHTNYVPGKGNQNKSYQVIGYACDLIDKGIDDPIKYAKDLVDDLNKGLSNKKHTEIGDSSSCKNLGYFIVKSMFDYLDMDYITNILASNKKFKFNLLDFIESMVYAQIVNPGSKYHAFEKVLPNIYGCKSFSYDQILDTINYIGKDYEKFIELLNLHIEKKWERKTNKSFFDCTNYYFEIDIPSDDKQKGPSKENRKDPIIGQGLLLDEDQIPLAMKMYPGNQSEKPQLRNIIEDIKGRYNINSKIVQVADKGLNCARNIYAASIEANDGYIFSKSIRGTSISNQEKQWIFLDNDKNVWHEVYDEIGNLKYKYKECEDIFDYKFIDDNGEVIKFKIKEKRIITYNPTLASKQRIQILKEVDKIKAKLSLKLTLKEEFGDSIKYVKFINKDSKGNNVKIEAELNQDKIEEDLKYAGYNMLVTSEVDKKTEEIYYIYHSLWRIEESFRIMKTHLEARPVYLQNKESIYGHFTICYYALTILRLLELKVFNDQVPISKLVSFIRGYNITETLEGSYINNATKSSTLDIIKKLYGINKLSYLNLRKKDVDDILNASLEDIF